MSKDLLSSAGIIIAIYALSLGLTVCVRKFLLTHAFLDRPNERSSHKIAVPRGGGGALLAILIPGMLLTAFQQSNLAHSGLIAGVIMLAAVSWLDDRRGASAGLRLTAHLLAACIGSFAFNQGETIFGGALPFWLDRALMIIGWGWFINLYNFMDGIDGITSVETIAIATGVYILLALAGINDPFADTLSLLLTGACLGFLVLNWHPAKIFLGDIGSVPLGYLSGFLLLSLAVRGQWAAALVLPLYYLADSGITLVRRSIRGDKVWQAHREHFYQHAALAVGRHDRVVYWIVAANTALIGAAITTVFNRWIGLAVAVAAVCALMRKMANESHAK